MSENGFSTVRLRTELVEAIDRLVEEKKDELGLQMFKSRADFVSEASKKLLKEMAKEAKAKQ